MNQNFDLDNYIQNLESDLFRANSLLTKISYARLGIGIIDEYDEENFEYAVGDLRLKMIFGLESLGQNTLIKEFEKKTDDISNQLVYLDIADCYYSPKLNLVEQYKDIISMVYKPENTHLNFLERILNSSAKLIYQRNLAPTREKDIQEELYKTIHIVYPDTIKEFKLASTVKNYVPDIGIVSVKCAIEVKFCDSTNDVKDAIAGIKTDMLSYNKSSDWTKFYGLIYMTEHYYSSEQIQLDFEKSPKNRFTKKPWTIISVVGPGARKKLKND